MNFIEENLKLIDEIHYRPILIVADNPNNEDDLYYGIEGNNVNVDKLYQMFVSITADLYQKGKITAQDVDKLKSSISESILLINNENIK